MKKIFLIALLLFIPQLWGDDVQIFKKGPVHEAFLTQEFGNVISEANPTKPPPALSELRSKQTDAHAIWIPGYWSWSKELTDYVWVSGTWRRPPPGHQWIAGYWKYYPEGWVWISGFWSTVPEKNLTFIAEPPPDVIDEKIPPSPSGNYFWVQGNWEYEQSSHQFIWYGGRWLEFDKDWVYVPAHYMWQGEGYVLVPGYWDWPIETRGMAYASIYISPNSRSDYHYQPDVVLDPLFVLELYYPYWPNYTSLYHHHYFYHPELWMAWGGHPPWWDWSSWWALPPQESWWLWWWWSHSGYPNPPWINAKLAESIAPPPQFILKMMKTVVAPLNVTPNGVVGDLQLIDVIEKLTKRDVPIISNNPKRIARIKGLANPESPEQPYLKPEGSERSKQGPEKPNFGPAVESFKSEPRRLKVPKSPTLEYSPPKRAASPIRKPLTESTTNIHLQMVYDSEPLESRRPQMSQHPRLPPNEIEGFHNRYPSSSVEIEHQAPQSHFHYYPEGPRRGGPQATQGHTPHYQYPQTPMQNEPQDRFMSKPMPQRNPPTPPIYNPPTFDKRY